MGFQNPNAYGQQNAVQQLAATGQQGGVQNFMPANMIVDANGRLATAMGNYSTASRIASEQEAAYKRSGEMIKSMQNNTPAKHWTGVIAKGLEGWAMSKERKRGEEASQKQSVAEADAQASKLAYEQAAEDKSFARDMQKIEYREMMDAKYAKDNGTEWQYRQNGFMRKEQIELLQENQKDVPPEMKMKDEAFDRYMQAEMKGNALRGGISNQTRTKQEQKQINLAVTGDTLQRLRDTVDPAFFGIKGAVKSIYGGILNYAGDVLPEFMDSPTARDLDYRKTAFQGSLFRYGSRVLHELSGAAVTASEWARFAKQYPMGSFASEQDFFAKLNSYIKDTALQKIDLQYRSGIGINEETGMLDESVASQMTGTEYQRRIADVMNYYDAQMAEHAPELSSNDSAEGQPAAVGDPYAEARQAITDGASPAAVNARLQEMGLDPIK